MNALYTAGTRQLSSIQKDLDELEVHIRESSGGANGGGAGGDSNVNQASGYGSRYGRGFGGAGAGGGIDAKEWAASQGMFCSDRNFFDG